MLAFALCMPSNMNIIHLLNIALKSRLWLTYSLKIAEP